MKLEGKCKYDFENWFNEVHVEMTVKHGFNYLHSSMKFGVIVDFADSVGYVINIIANLPITKKLDGFWMDVDLVGLGHKASERIGTRPETREAAVKQFNKWYNER